MQAALISPDYFAREQPMTNGLHKLTVEEGPYHALRIADSAWQCIQQLFEAQVERAPDAIAMVCDGQQYTYQCLNARANQLAHYLRSLGVKPESLVGLCVERSFDMLVGILGILKAGGAYVPLDLSYPLERLEFMLADAQIEVLLTQQPLLPKLPTCQAQIVLLDHDYATFSRYAATNPSLNTQASNLAYVIYTSGSTGQPKGVMVQHHNVHRLFSQTNAWFGFNAHDAWTLFHSYAFDFSVWEIWGALLYGGRLVIVPYLISRSPSQFCQLLLSEGVTVLNQTPSAFLQLAREVVKSAEPPALSLRYIIFGGEALELKALQPWFTYFAGHPMQLVNMYGITETTVHVTYKPISLQDVTDDKGSLIGVPIADLQLFLLDEQLQTVSPGSSGELYVAGPGLARGYLNRPELTAARFIANPFSSEPNARLYKTGDLASYDADGNLEYLGRIDQQVKIRGFRIELQEIESVLTQIPEVKAALVNVFELSPGDKRLVAYLITQDAVPLATLYVRNFLRDKLPGYMLPSAIEFVAEFPLTPNGKLDRKALPAPSIHYQSRHYVAPTNAIEASLVSIWETLFGLAPLGVQDNFFELGGHSLIAVRLLTELELAFPKITFNLTQIYEYPTIAKLAQTISANVVVPAKFSLLPINAHGARPPLFVLHVIRPNALEIMQKLMGGEQPLYFVRYGMAATKQGDFLRLPPVAALAAHYLEEIQAVQPHGPYHLLGFSFGGLLAYEIACQLEAKGEGVNLLALVDTHLTLHQERLAWEQVCKNILSLSFEHLLNRLKIKWERFRQQRRADEFFPHFYTEGPDLKASLAFQPKVYNGQAVLYFKALQRIRESIFFYDPDLEQAWRELLPHPLIVHELDCGHNGILEGNHLVAVINLLMAHIDNTLTKKN